MAGTYKGLGVPINGEFYRYTESAQTQTWYAEDNGVLNITIDNSATTASADNYLALTVTDGGARTSGYANVFYTNLTVSGNLGSGVAVNQVNAFGADITLDGTSSAAGYGGMYIYIAASASWSDANAVVYGACFDIQELGSLDYKANIWLQNTSTTAATSVDAYILFSNQGATGGQDTSMFFVQGITYPKYFLRLSGNTTKDMFQVVGVGEAANSDAYLKVMAGTQGYSIPMYAAT